MCSEKTTPKNNLATSNSLQKCNLDLCYRVLVNYIIVSGKFTLERFADFAIINKFFIVFMVYGEGV